MAEVVQRAIDLVCLWESATIAGLARKQRNWAIEDTRERLVAAVQTLADTRPKEAALGPAVHQELQHG